MVPCSSNEQLEVLCDIVWIMSWACVESDRIINNICLIIIYDLNNMIIIYDLNNIIIIYDLIT